jgi:hypothetical protein
MPTSFTFTQESDFRREREFGQKISATFEFIRAHWRPLGRVMLYTVAPAALLFGLLSAALQVTLMNRTVEIMSGDKVGVNMQWAATAEMMSSPAYWLVALLRTAFSTLIILSVYGYVLCCLRGPRDAENAGFPAGSVAGTPDITAAEVWAIIKREFLSMFLSTMGITAIVVFGLAFAILPGLYLMVMLSLFFIIKLVEGTGFGDTISRCRQLIRGKWWSTFGLLLVMALLFYSIFFLVGLVSSLFGASLLGLIQSGILQSPAFIIITSALGTGLLLLFYPLVLLALAFQYFNLVERHEGVGLHRLVGQLGQAAPTARNASFRPEEEGEY